MEFIRHLWMQVVICVLVFGSVCAHSTPGGSAPVVHGSAYGPAASSTSSVPYIAPVISPSSKAIGINATADDSGASSTGIYYVPGWNCKGWYDSLGAAESACSAGAAEWAGGAGWTLVWEATGPAPPNPFGAAYGIYCVTNASCVWHGGAFTAPDGSNYLNGNSHGGEDVFEQDCNFHYYWDGDTHTCITAAVDPTKNLGDGAGCDGGDGSPNGDSSAQSSADGDGANSCQSGQPMAGDPINTSTGNSYQQTTDIRLNHWLTLRRFYNSGSVVASSTLGAHWRNSFDRSLRLAGSPVASIKLLRPDGKQESFAKASGSWVTDADNPDSLAEQDDSSGNPTSYVVFVAGPKQFEYYSAAGVLQSIEDESGFTLALAYSTSTTPAATAPVPGLLLTATDPSGRKLSFTYDSKARISQVTMPDGGTVLYAYDANNNLSAVTYPDGNGRHYVYNEPSLTNRML